MRSHIVLAAAVAAVFASSASAAILYNPIVTMVGDGSAPVSGQARTTALRVYQNSVPSQPVPISELSYNSGASAPRLTTSTSATSEGMLSNNPAVSDAAAAGASYNGTVYSFSAGYDAANLTASVNSTAANAPRAVGYMNATNSALSGAAVPVTQPQANYYENNNNRAATGDDAAANYWTAGTATNNPGWRYINTNTQLSATAPTNVRTVEIRNGQLFGSTASGSATHGIFAIGTGTPTSSGNSITQMINTGSASSSYEFVLLDDPSNAASTATTFGFDTAYIADDSSTAAGGGIQKWVFNGTAWSLSYTLNDGVGGNRGLAGQLDPDTGKAVLWATSALGDKLEQVTDLGAGALSPFTTLAVVPTNDVFRGVALTTLPVPEPSSLAGIGVIGFIAARKRRRSASKPR